MALEADQHKYRCQNRGQGSQRHHSLEVRHGRPRSKVCLLNAVANWRTRRLTNFMRFPHRVWTISKKKTEDLEIVGELSETCSQIVLKCLYSARIGRPDLLWTVTDDQSQSGTERAISDWHVSISYIHHTTNYGHYCHVGNQATDCKLRFFQDADVARTLTDSKSTPDGVPCVLGKQTFVPISCACKKQTAVSHTPALKLKLHRLMQICGTQS